MEGISKQELIRVKENMPDGTSKLFVHTLITMCKELPAQQWQTIDEFKANPVDGDYHIMFGAYKLILFYRQGAFWSSQTENRLFVHQDGITHVMPIITPEVPK